MNKFVLGTAQLGMPYGIANMTGQPCIDTATEIIRTALELGISEFDTAQAYGTSETVLGNSLALLNKAGVAKIISKTDPALDHLNRNEMRKGLEGSLRRLHQSRLYGYMLHREDYLDLWKRGIGKIMSEFVHEGKVNQIGISVYSPERAIQALNNDDISFIQIPFNLFDHRFKKANVFELAKKAGKSVYIRSIFLQGLFLIHPDKLPKSMNIAKPALERLNHLRNEFKLSLLEIAIGYVRHAAPEAQIVFGAESVQQVKENTACRKYCINPDLFDRLDREFNNLDEKIINPTLWKI